jgi:regulator of protease activity HflC (stomatin/prohibitin superfamily)
LKNILPPIDIRKAMEKQMRAEREKRQQILIAEGDKTASILVAEGQKASAILRAEGTKQAIDLINASNPTPASLKLKSYDALIEVSKGESTTILLPTDLTDVSKIVATAGTILSKTNKKKKTSKSLSKLISDVS